MLRLVVVFLCALLSAAAAPAASITVAGFTFNSGEQAFADNAFLVSGSIRLCGATSSIAAALTGSDLLDCINSAETAGGFVEVLFTDNTIVNGSGPDFVIFELSGPLGAGTPDPREIFGVSVFDGSSFSPFQTVTPVDTGSRTTGGVNPGGVFAVQIDLAAFGIPADASTDRLRLHIFNANLGTKSGDITAIGALNAGQPVPEPGTAFLLILALSILSAARRRNLAVTRCSMAVAAALSILVASALSEPAAANVIVNGSFEAPGSEYGPFGIETGSTYFPGWIVSRGDVDYGGPGGCGDGLHCLDLDGYTFGGVAQTFSTEPGVQYRVSFMLSGNSARYSESEPAEKYLGVSAAGSSTAFVFAVVPNEHPLRWTSEEWLFTPTESVTTIEFYSLDSFDLGHSGLFGPMLDAAVVEPVPEPSTAALFAVGLIVLGHAARCRPTRCSSHE